MNTSNLSQLLVLNRSISAPGPKRTRPGWSGRNPLLHLTVAKGSACQVNPALSRAEHGSTLPSRRGLATGLTFVGMLLVIILAASFVVGMQRVRYVRQNYHLSLQLKQREREVDLAQRAYHALAAFAAVQGAQTSDLAEMRRAALPMPVTAPKRGNRS
jgi:hypothetical protein